MVGRQGGWPEGMHSCLSGFIDAGETAEETVRREVGEETGLEVGPVPEGPAVRTGVTGLLADARVDPSVAELGSAKCFCSRCSERTRRASAADSFADLTASDSPETANRPAADRADWGLTGA
ncbi:hypothetical protein FNF27_05175 [Cafeteria roenbergensis]|uniref:Nudix hydrolase domain-containing protein n=1 Tax=Cafeteria roenbergensis TaxID=33653 RepID=A0A5A8E7W5_CAFRO|nr:hypothetical protein FNF27_05175 [Cafeteria roenbergensis]